MTLRTCAIVAFAGILASCSSPGRSPQADAPVSPVIVNAGPLAPAAAPEVVPAPAESVIVVATRIVAVEEIARAKRASTVAHPHDYKNFSRAQYVADPDRYLGKVVGGRIYEVSNPAADVDALAPAGARGFSVPTNGEATLAARTEPGMPVTFTSFGLGEFPASGLQSISVAADEHGVARAQFRVTPGTVGSCLVTAGSPVRANTLNFLITIPEAP